jgi:chromosome segregation ATPase
VSYEQEAQEKSSEEVLQELERQNAQLDLLANVAPGVLEQYEKRKQEIENLSKTIEQKEKKVAKAERKIKSARVRQRRSQTLMNPEYCHYRKIGSQLCNSW